MKRDLDDIAAFVQAVVHGGFAPAGRAIGCTPSAVSKRVGRLENQMGIALLSRTTRKLALTAAGRAFYESCSVALAQIETAQDAAIASRKVPQGLLRVKVQQAFGRIHVAPLIPKFLSRYPHVRLELLFGNFSPGLMEDEIDVLIAAADPSDSNLASRTIVPIERVTCASPEYFTRNGRPLSFKDLAGHNCLMFSDSTFPANEWIYILSDGIERVRVTGNFVTNNGDAIVRAVLEGVGIAHIPSFVVEAALSSGRLEVIFRDHVSNRRMMKAYYAPAKHRLSRVQVFVDFLIDEIKANADVNGRSLTQLTSA